MLTEHEDILTYEALAEQQELEDDSSDLFFGLLLIIILLLKQNKPIRTIKKEIVKRNINKNLPKTLNSFMQSQYKAVVDVKEDFDISPLLIGAYSFDEVVKMQKSSTINQALKFMVMAKDEIIKNGDVSEEDISNFKERYNKTLERTYRTAGKAIREQGYYYIDEKMGYDNIRGWISVAILDSRTSGVCASLHNKFYLKKDYRDRLSLPHQIPRHPNCRSQFLTVYKNTRITNYKGQKLQTFLSQNPKIAKKIMGQKKYAIYKTGKADFNKFVDLKGDRFFTNDEIIQRLGITSETRLKKINAILQK